MSGKIVRYFAGGNTARGFYSLYDSNLEGLKQVLLLSGRSQREKALTTEKLLETCKNTDSTIEVIHSSLYPDRIEGFIIRDASFAIIDSDAPRVIGEDYVGPEWETIDLDQVVNSEELAERKEDILILKKRLKEHYNLAHKAYETGLRVHDDWEDIYIKQMDFQKADEVATELVSNLFSEKNEEGTKKSNIIRRFLGAATPIGPVDFVNNITEGLTKRFFLKGRAGTGKSTLLRRVVKEAEQRGLDMEIYHCGFDPNSLDMVIVRELGWAVFDSTAPHEYFPSRPGDEVVDMYELTVAPGTDEAFAEKIAKIEAKYREQMKLGKHHLMEVRRTQDQLEEIYKTINNQDHLDMIYSELEQLLESKIK